MMKRMIMPLVLTLLLVLTACSGGKSSESPDSKPGDTAAGNAKTHESKGSDLAVGEQQHLPNGDLQQVTASATELPAFLDDKSDDLKLVYEVAGSAADILQWMPCYCGCADSADHGSNLNCFVDEIRKDGSVVWDDHGTRCNVCVEIAVKSVTMAKEGKSLKEIREKIDSDYKEGYARPTDTPMPA